MDKKTKYVIGALCLGIVLFGVGYIFAAKKIYNPDLIGINEQKLETMDRVSFKNIRKDGNKIVKSFNVIMNDVKKTMDIEFTVKENGEYSRIDGVFKGKVIYSRDEKTVDIKTKFTEKALKGVITEKNFRILKGDDEKSNLLVTANLHNIEQDKLYILDDTLGFLEGDMQYDYFSDNDAFTIRSNKINYAIEGIDKGYADQFSVCESDSCFVNLKIDGSKIYYLKVLPGDEVNLNGTVEERIYIINDSKLGYTVKNTYRIESIFGQLGEF